jgi:hypothetical protein
MRAMTTEVPKSAAEAPAGKKPWEVGEDSHVTVAFTLGWQMAELLRPDPQETGADVSVGPPSLSALSTSERKSLALDQVEAALEKLSDSLGGKEVADSEKARAALEGENAAGTIEALDAEILRVLTPADFRLGKSYKLGRALAKTCRQADSLENLFDEAGFREVERIRRWLKDLTTQLPAHAGHSVSGSLERWQQWAKENGARRLDGDVRQKARWLLAREGEVWRSILSGEKLATDMLELGDYVSAAEGLLIRMRDIGWRFLRRFWVGAFIAVALFAGGVVLILTQGTKEGVIAGLTGVLASLGLSWKGATASLQRVALRAGDRLWDAELDRAIVNAITELPTALGKPRRWRRKEQEPWTVRMMDGIDGTD